MTSYRYRQTVLTEVARRGLYSRLEKMRRLEPVEQTAVRPRIRAWPDREPAVRSSPVQHPEQITLLKNERPGMPAGCLIERLKMESLTETIKDRCHGG